MYIVTFLGMIGGDNALYEVESSLKLANERKEAVNMLFWLMQNFPDANIVAVGTKDSIERQRELFKQNGIVDSFPNGSDLIQLENENDFDAVFAKLGEIVENAPASEVVVDITHSFRHLPVLMSVQMIIESVSSPKKIKHILFAKEIEKNEKYEIIDLKRYLDLSTVSYALASFNDNYTVGKSVRVADKNYESLLELLSQFGEHMLANSFEELFFAYEPKRPLAQRILDALDAVEKHKAAFPIQRHIKKIRSHIGELVDISKGLPDERLYGIGKLLLQKGYLLNAITLLDEAISLYCLEGIRKADKRFDEAISEFEMKIQQSKEEEKHDQTYNRYNLSKHANDAIKYVKKNKNGFLGNEELQKLLIEKIDFKKTQGLRNLIYASNILRNDLAHGNMHKRHEDIVREIEKLYKMYRKIASKNGSDPLGRFKER